MGAANVSLQDSPRTCEATAPRLQHLCCRRFFPSNTHITMCWATVHYAGLTSISFKDYSLASWAGMLPATFAYVWVHNRPLGCMCGEGGPGKGIPKSQICQGAVCSCLRYPPTCPSWKCASLLAPPHRAGTWGERAGLLGRARSPRSSSSSGVGAAAPLPCSQEGPRLGTTARVVLRILFAYSPVRPLSCSLGPTLILLTRTPIVPNFNPTHLYAHCPVPWAHPNPTHLYAHCLFPWARLLHSCAISNGWFAPGALH